MNSKKEIGIGIFFLILAILYYIASLGISTFDPFAAGRSGIQLDSRSVPQTLSFLIAILSIVHIIGNALKLRKEKTQTAFDIEPPEKKMFKFGRPQRLMVITVVLVSAYIFFYVQLGFVAASILYLLAQMLVLIPSDKRKKWAVFTVCFSVGMPVGIYLIFTRAISMFLPRGLLWWL